MKLGMSAVCNALTRKNIFVPFCVYIFRLDQSPRTTYETSNGVASELLLTLVHGRSSSLFCCFVVYLGGSIIDVIGDHSPNTLQVDIKYIFVFH